VQSGGKQNIDVSEEPIASIFRVQKEAEQNISLKAGS
jgi:hypothetical protein